MIAAGAIEHIDDTLRVMADCGADPKKFIRQVFQPGSSVLHTGERGKGKSFGMIGMTQLAMLERPKSVTWTNVVFIKAKNIEPNGIWEPGCDITWEKCWPEGVTKVTSMEKVFRLTGEILEDDTDLMEDPDFCIYIDLDEFQNFISADEAWTPLAQTYYKYAANIRKFRHCDQKSSPSSKSIPPKLRNFTDDINNPGYVSTHFRKQRYFVEKFNRCWGTRIDPKYFTTVKMSFDHEEELVELPKVTWNIPKNEVSEGDIIYDHLSTADFTLSENPDRVFSFQKLIQELGGAAFFEVPTVIMSFFDKWDKGDDSDLGMNRDYEMALRIREMRRMDPPIKWEDIARIESRKRQTCQTIYKKYTNQLDLDIVEQEEARQMR